MNNYINVDTCSVLSSALAYAGTISCDGASICVGAVEPYEEKEKMPDKAKTLIHPDCSGRNICLKIADDKGYVVSDKLVMSDIVDVQVIERQYKSQVVVFFADRTSETATLDYCDQFNLEQGISICIAKKLLSGIIGKDYGSSTYNKLIDRAVKVFKKNETAREKKATEEEAKKRKYEKMVAKKKAKRQKREAEEREKQIEIQKEAILRALNQWKARADD